MDSRLISSRLFLSILLIASLGISSLAMRVQKSAKKASTKQTAADASAADDSSDNYTRGLKPREYAQQLNIRIAGRRTNNSALSKEKKPLPSFVAKVNIHTDKPLAKGEDVGVTLWLLSEAVKTDDKEVQEKTRIAVRKKGKETEQIVNLVARRASPDTLFQDGDRLRFSLESPFEGYVYIINRERYGENDYSDPYLIYPSKRDVGVADKGRPDQALFIPKDDDSFELRKFAGNQKEKQAEVFYVIISKKPIAELPPLDTDDPRKIEPALFEKWREEWNTGTTEFEQKYGKGVSIKMAEKEASVAKRGRLKENDPLPQTVYHVTSNSKDALIFEMQIKIKS